jgi:hypothetical protein
MENTNLKSVLEYCEEKKLYFGEGNPNAKILFVGQEIGFGHEEKEDKKPNIDEIIKRAEEQINGNLCNWQKHCHFGLEQCLKNMEQFFKQKTNPTWKSYQKIVNGILGGDITEKRFDFLNDCFITEFSQLSLPNSSYLKNDKEFAEIKKQSIKQRKELFKQDFFQNFPIVIMACGHYSKDFDFNMEEIFGVKWVGKTEELSRGNYYNVNKENDKILIHTRQVSTGVSDLLLSEIAKEIRNFKSKTL